MRVTSKEVDEKISTLYLPQTSGRQTRANSNIAWLTK
jgi:hypothetical protein